MAPSSEKICGQCGVPFVIEPDDFSFYEKMGVLAPRICPLCRFKRRALFRNETTLYSRTCARCNKRVISMYHSTSPYTIYCEGCWDSDAWDPYEFGAAYDPSRPFLDQIAELWRRVPKKTTMISASSKLGPNVRSEYTNYAGGNKDSYFIFNAGGDENCGYLRGVSLSQDSFDGYFGTHLERCYETVNVDQSSGVQYGQNVVGSIDSAFLFQASNIQNCFGCVNLRGKSYYFLNEPLSRDEYKRRTGEIRGSHANTEAFKWQFNEFSLEFPRRATSNLKSVESESDYLLECKRVRDSFEAYQCEDSRYLFSVKWARDIYDHLGFGYDSELCLENVAAGYSNRIIGAWWAEQSQELEYCAAMRTCKNCIGCDSLKNAQYCILNRRYEKGEYEKLRAQIVKTMKREGTYGLYYPPSMAPFGWNETVGQDNVPMTREEAKKEGLPWQDEPQVTRGKETMKPEQIPDHIRDVSDVILNEILACASCGRNYRLIPSELAFYRQAVIPVPRRCFYCRHADRILRRGPMKLFPRTCDHCKKSIKTSYAPDRPEIVYCESCYQSEIV